MGRSDTDLIDALEALADKDEFSHWMIEEDNSGGANIQRGYGSYKDADVNWPCGESETLRAALNQYLDEVLEKANA